MGLTFANLAGLWALLGIPVILLIHFLQKERREITVSTLFLLENMQRESKSGIRFERLRNSLPLWLQILAVLLLTWILTEPRWIRPDSFQRIVVVLDSSASMSPFREEALSALDRRMARLARTTARQEWIVLESDRRRGALYSGGNAAELRAALNDWQPRAGTRDFLPVLEEARTLLRREGSTIFVTSRPPPTLPAGVHLLAVGSPIENCGFTGVRMEKSSDGLVWHALARNYGHSIQTREWRAVFDDRIAATETLRLAPGQTVALSGRFPSEAEEGFLEMTGDSFELDDWMPLVRPHPKPLAIAVEEHPLLDGFSEVFLRSLPDWSPPGEAPADLRLATRLEHQTDLAHPGIYFLAEPEPPKTFLTEALVAEHHPLMRDLNWQGLLVQAETAVTLSDEDRVLLWQGERPLIVLRESGRNRWLFCNFDLRHSNAGRLPAFVIFLHRNLDQIRDAKPGFEQRNLQTGQRLSASFDPLGEPLTFQVRDRQGVSTEAKIEPHRAASMLAPGEPGFIELRQNGQALFRAAVHFADSREADFRTAKSEERGFDHESVLLQRNTTADFLTPLWLLLLGGLLLSNWWLTGRRENP